MRNRLTKRYASKNVKAESQADGLFPGDVGNMERSKNYHAIDEYHTFEQTVNHELPDMRHEWKDNPRTETGHGIPKVAKVYMAAKQATKLAMMFLGEDAKDDEVEAQAKDFMRMGSKALTASVNRWVRAAEEACEGKECEADEVETEEAPETTTAEETATAPAEEVAAEETPAEAPAEVTAEEETAEPTAEEAPVEACGDAVPETAGEEETDVCAEDEADVEVTEAETPAEVDFDEADEEEEVEADPELAEVFEGADEGDENEVAPVEEAPVAKKSGIKRIAGQPKLVRVAKKAADELEGLWSKWESPKIR